MLWRVRAETVDRPGALAELAAACGRLGVNIQRVQVFPGADAATIELVLQVPQDWRPAQVRELVAGAGSSVVSAVPVTTAALEDQPTRYIEAIRAIIAQPATFPDAVAHLLDADIVPREGPVDVLEMTVKGSATIQVRRDPPFTETERARAMALAQLVGEVLDTQGPPAPHVPTAGDPDFVTDGLVVSALAGGKLAGRAEATQPSDDEPWAVDLWVDPAWHRRGVGTQLLADIARAARSAGAEEIALTAPADSKAVLPMVLAAGMRGRIRMAGESLSVRIAISDLRGA